MIFKPTGTLLITTLFTGSSLLYAKDGQTPPPPAAAGPPPPVGLPTPIDQELWFLLVLGVLLGIYILYKKNFSPSAA